MKILYLTHRAFFRHHAGAHHPERPERLQAVQEGVEDSGLPIWVAEPPEADEDLLGLSHTPAYIAHVKRVIKAGGGRFDPDTAASPESWEAAVRAAGAGPHAARLLEKESDGAAFLAVRPPGHHALVDRAMGFCLFNNVAITARYLRGRGARVAIVDWDVHHGNGTDAEFADEPEVFYISAHQWPYYPGTGAADEVGSGPGRGYTINAAWPQGTAGDVYRRLFLEMLTPRLRSYAPDWLLVSCGFDAHHLDPLAGLRLTAADYHFMASQLREIVPSNRILVFLEGGYHLGAIARSTRATLLGLAGKPLDGPGSSLASPARAHQVFDILVDIHQKAAG